jgi:hypothetical protein
LFSQRLLRFLRQDWASCLLFFVVGLVLRGVPELLVSTYPVGYETITYYAPALIVFSRRSLMNVFASAFCVGSPADFYSPLLSTFRAGPLFYVLLWFVTVASSADVYVLLKVVGPLLYGFLAVSFFVFLRRGLRLDWKMAFVASSMLVFQIVALRESWDRFRTVLGLTFLLGAFTAFRSDPSFKHRWLLVAFFGVLTALSRDYVALVLLVAIFGFAVLEKRDRLVSLLALAPTFIAFAVMSYPSWPWWNFISPSNPFATTSYSGMVQDALSIFVVCYLLLLPFVLKGFWRDRLLDPMVCWLLVGSFSVVTNPWIAVPGYQRWLMLLVFPFCIYAVRGFERWRLFERSRIWMLKVILLVFIVIGAGYSTGLFSYVGVLPNSYVAVNLVQSSIPLSQIDDVKNVLAWIDENAQANSCLLTKEEFYGWALNYLRRANRDVMVVPYGASSSPWSTLKKVLGDGFRSIYLIWYTNSTLKDFEAVYSNTDISVFEYRPQAVLA